LGISQVAVSRLLKKAEEHGIVRTTVVTPPGAFAELEELIEHRFGLGQVIIGEATSDSEEAVPAAIGSAAAQFLEAAVKSGEVKWINTLVIDQHTAERLAKAQPARTAAA
jgi:DNA-binding transcriptional regulator LsrR (DeoR family)